MFIETHSIEYYVEYKIQIKLPKKGVFKRLSNKIKGVQEPETKELTVVFFPGSQGGVDAKVGGEYLHYVSSMGNVSYIERIRPYTDDEGRDCVISEVINAYGYSVYDRDYYYSVGAMYTVHNVDREIGKCKKSKTEEKEM